MNGSWNRGIHEHLHPIGYNYFSSLTTTRIPGKLRGLSAFWGSWARKGPRSFSMNKYKWPPVVQDRRVFLDETPDVFGLRTDWQVLAKDVDLTATHS